MKTHEKYALLDYLEFHLVTLCEDVIPDYDNAKVTELYKKVFFIIDDLDASIEPTDESINSQDR